MKVIVQIQGASDGKSKVELEDGTDISHLCAGVTLRHMAGRQAELTLHVMAQAIEAKGSGEVSHVDFAGLGPVKSVTLEDGRVIEDVRAVYAEMIFKAIGERRVAMPS